MHQIIGEVQGLEYIRLHKKHYDSIAIHPEGLAKIREIIAQYQACERCKGYITPTNPEVYRRCCLACAKRELRGYSYVLHTTKDGSPCHAFVDNNNGQLYLASPVLDGLDPHYDCTIETLRHHGHQLPTATHTKSGLLMVNRWSRYGDPRRSVVILRNASYSNETVALFIVRKDAEAEELDRRRKAHGELWREATRIVRRPGWQPTRSEGEIARVLADKLSWRVEVREAVKQL